DGGFAHAASAKDGKATRSDDSFRLEVVMAFPCQEDAAAAHEWCNRPRFWVPAHAAGIPSRGMKEHVSSETGGRSAASWMADAMPVWLAGVMRNNKVPVPWGAMTQAMIAIWVPLAIGIASGNRSLGLLPAMGGLMSIMTDQGGTYRSRVKRVAIA